MIAFLIAAMRAVIESVLHVYGKQIGKRSASDATAPDPGLLRRGGNRVRAWLHAHGANPRNGGNARGP